MKTDLWELTARELTDGYGTGMFTPLEALTSIEGRLDAVNANIKAVIAEDRGAARAQAKAATLRWRAGQPLSPIDGVPLTIKDNLLSAGLPATWGSKLYSDHVPAQDEAPVARLRAAGAVFLGKTNVPEFTLQGYTANLTFGTTENPHAPGMTPGGSTGGGAAAVAAGIGPVAIGTDGGGSLRRPAAHCGLYALKPSIGQIARYNGFPQILLDFEVVGPVARSVEDLSAVFSVLKGYDPTDPSSLSALAPPQPLPRRARIAYLPKIGPAPVDPLIAEAADAFAMQLGEAGHFIETIETPYNVDSVSAAWSTIAAAGLHCHLNSVGKREGLGTNALALDAQGGARTGADYAGAMAVALAARADAGRLLSHYDLLVCPSTAALAWAADTAYPAEIDGKPVGPRGHAVFTGWMNVTGVCAINIPVAMTADRGGIGIQLVAAVGRDAELIDFVSNLPPVRALGPARLSRRFD
ncbi:amidase [Rhizobium lusitanum]|uniref:amidase n=1 Tax=Rhizobium lusitanum TaxID=293958 RepID=UPI00195B7ACF|nr:amidase [Rhizobium lusitanum]MBM7044740.1 amidase [Rhizobium lusitanum]